MQQGLLKPNAIAIFNGEFSFMGPTVTLKTKAAFVDTSTGHTHGWTNGEGGIWSKATIDAANALRESMEMDLAKLHFQDGTSETVTEGGAAVPKREGGGLLEHLGGEEDAPQA